MTIILGVLLALAVITIGSIIAEINKKNRDREYSRSNARVLKEYKNISVHRPTHIVNHANNRRESNGNTYVGNARPGHVPQEPSQD